MNGIINVLKPAGMTSSNVVSVIRRLANQKKVGHLGTLDPAAAGVLPIMLGRATRLFDILSLHDKEYYSEFAFGVGTDTLDAQGKATERIPWSGTEEDVARALKKWTGDIEQVPPMYSAIKRDGKKLYDLARKGVELELPTRHVTVYEMELDRLIENRAGVRIHCSRGTYVRSLCRDTAAELGTVGHTAVLLRTRTGRYKLEDSFTLGELEALASEGRLAEAVETVEDALTDVPAYRVPDGLEKPLSHGAKLYLHQPGPDHMVRLYCKGTFYGLGHGEVLEDGTPILKIDQLLLGHTSVKGEDEE